MTTKRICLLFAAVMLVATGQPKPIEQADIEARYSDTFSECTRDALATADTVFCLTKEAEIQEPKLEKAYAATLKRLTPKRKAALRSAQANWRKEAQAKCDEAAAGLEFERVAEAERGQCMLDATIRRTIELERSVALARR
jgi:uncharacterized protein YecT (DUF1311 family)